MVMNPTIIFDMDGVIVRSEQLWNDQEPAYFARILEPSIAQQLIGNTRGLAESLIYEKAKELGHTGTKEDFFSGYDVLAQTIYREAPITIGIDSLIATLAMFGVRLGLVSSSPKNWINIVLDRLKHGTAFEFVESVNDHPELAPKPAPDGYVAAMKALGSTNTETLIIEDSQTGINAAIASGAHVCGFALHMDGELPHGADIFSHTMEELERHCQKFIAHCRMGAAFP
mgnify:CR=1 FL=1